MKVSLFHTTKSAYLNGLLYFIILATNLPCFCLVQPPPFQCFHLEQHLAEREHGKRFVLDNCFSLKDHDFRCFHKAGQTPNDPQFRVNKICMDESQTWLVGGKLIHNKR